MIVGVPRESFPGERRVALVPMAIPVLAKAGLEVIVQAGAGIDAGYPDADYVAKGAKSLRGSRRSFSHGGHHRADAVLRIERSDWRSGPAVIPTRSNINWISASAGKRGDGAGDCVDGVTSFSVELMPRTTRAQSMDVLSSMGTIAGYKAVVIAADKLPRLFPMLTTAAGTITPARVFIIGAGVAGLAGDCNRAETWRDYFVIRYAAGVERTGAKFGRAICGAAD